MGMQRVVLSVRRAMQILVDFDDIDTLIYEACTLFFLDLSSAF